jgi:hypothetical protein
MVSEAVEQRRRHLGIDEDGWPFAEGEIGRDDDGRALIEAADEMEQQLAASLRKGQIAELVENDEVQSGQIVGEPSLPAGAAFGLDPIDELKGYVLSVGGFLGMGARHVAVDPAGVNVQYDANGKKWMATTSATKDDLKAAPEFKYEGQWNTSKS